MKILKHLDLPTSIQKIENWLLPSAKAILTAFKAQTSRTLKRQKVALDQVNVIPAISPPSSTNIYITLAIFTIILLLSAALIHQSFINHNHFSIFSL
jgi:hypothetical protein